MEEYIPPSSVRKGKEFVIWLFYEKSAQVVVRFRAQKVLSRQIHEKSFSISSWTYSTELRAGEEVYPTQKGQIDNRIFDLVVLRHKCSGGCQISSSKNSL